MKYLAFTLSPAVPRSITGRYKNNIGKKTALQSSSPVLCTAKYRGGVRRTEGLKKKTKKYGYSTFTGKSKALINPI